MAETRNPWVTMWGLGVRHGLQLVTREPILGLKRLVLPVGYWRTVEFSYVWRRLAPVLNEASTVLDLGSPKRLAFFLADARRASVVATDILRKPIREAARTASRRRLARGVVMAGIEDGRRLSFRDDVFDATYSVSVLEHIPDGGDTLALRELLRVTRPGGQVIVTVPYDRAHRDTFRKGDVYERRARGDEPIFFERHYDARTLASRLTGMEGADLVDLEIWGEGRFRAERFLRRLGRADVVAAPLEPLMSRLFLRPVQATDRGTTRPMAAFFTLVKR